MAQVHLKTILAEPILLEQSSATSIKIGFEDISVVMLVDVKNLGKLFEASFPQLRITGLMPSN
jgi:hypothetical protein